MTADKGNNAGKIIGLQKADLLAPASPAQSHYAGLFREGDEEGLKFFFLEFHPSLALFANRWVDNRSIAEEIASEAFIQTWKIQDKPGNYFKIKAYLYKATERISLRALSRERNREKTHQKAQLLAAPKNDTPFDHLVRNETYRLIHSYLKELPPGSRKVLMMHYLEGKSTGEIATELNLAPSTIKSQKAQGLKALRKKLLGQMLILLLLSSQVFFAHL